MSRTNQALSPAQMFFYRNAGHSYDPKTETSDQGRIRCAILLERAENDYLGAHRVADVHFEFEPDVDVMREPGCQPDEQWQATLYHGDRVLASLGAIDTDSADYQRVIRAQLAQEASDALRAIVETAGAAQ